MSKIRVAYLLVCLIAAAVVGASTGRLFAQNSDAYEFFGTTLTVFAGFLFAVLSLLGDPSLIEDGSWRKTELKREGVESSIIRIGYLFVLYVIAILSLAVSVLLKTPDLPVTSIQLWVARATMFLSTLALLLTLPLPIIVARLQMWRYDNEIERRKSLTKTNKDSAEK